MSLIEPGKQCSLVALAGLRIPEPCRRSTCALWQGGCAVELLGLDGGDSELADFLLSVRGGLELNSLLA